jgi:hypothetical protein
MLTFVVNPTKLNVLIIRAVSRASKSMIEMFSDRCCGSSNDDFNVQGAMVRNAISTLKPCDRIVLHRLASNQ